MAQLLSNLPMRALIKFGKHQVGSETAQPIIWMIADKNHSGYPSNSVTLITEKIIDIRAFDAMERNGSSTNWGDDNYNRSNINMWLNSSAAPGKWYTPVQTIDGSPTNDNVTSNTSYADRAGFLYNFTESERNALLPTTLTTRESFEDYATLVTKVFLPSIREMGMSYQATSDSSVLSCFASGGITAKLTSQAYTNTPSTSKPASVDSNWSYFSRNSENDKVYAFSASGGANQVYPYEGSHGVRPIINLSARTKVSDSTDSDGCYTVLSQVSPVISGTNGDLGNKGDGFTQTYVVTDGDNEAVTVTEYINNNIHRTYVVTLGATNKFDVTGAAWLKLTNGVHTLKIVATDGFDDVTRTFTFTKSITSLVVQRDAPITSSTMPKSIIVTVVKNIPTEAIFKVEACNNGFDTSPTWEDITNDVTRGEIYDFTNTSKTATQWGVNIRVTVDRNGAEGACYITEIGGNFE